MCGNEWDCVTFLALWLIFGPLVSSFSFKYSRFYNNTEAWGNTEHILVTDRCEALVKAFEVWRESIRPYLSLLEKFTFQKLGCSGPVEMRRAELKRLMLTFSDRSISQASTLRMFWFRLCWLTDFYLTWWHFHFSWGQILGYCQRLFYNCFQSHLNNRHSSVTLCDIIDIIFNVHVCVYTYNVSVCMCNGMNITLSWYKMIIARWPDEIGCWGGG